MCTYVCINVRFPCLSYLFVPNYGKPNAWDDAVGFMCLDLSGLRTSQVGSLRDK